MTSNEFLALCNANGISPEIALENENLATALYKRDNEKVEKIIKTEF
tara:strand:+ start:451 stop:591 length:141 start_codon:yes stop_codon:yes gene_type:complete